MSGMSGNCHSPGFSRVFVLPVASLCGDQIPPVLLNHLDCISDLHNNLTDLESFQV